MFDRIKCDRCGEFKEGAHEQGFMTAGCYDVSGPVIPGSWANARRQGESLICDDCMWADPWYIGVYGYVTTAT